eukprot:4805151-Prymnesium_polylepis.1
MSATGLLGWAPLTRRRACAAAAPGPARSRGCGSAGRRHRRSTGESRSRASRSAPSRSGPNRSALTPARCSPVSYTHLRAHETLMNL